jgi:hypothetical protein
MNHHLLMVMKKKLFSKLSIGGEDYHKILDTLKKNNPSLFLSLKKIDEKDVEKIGDGKREDYYEYKETTIFNLLCDGYSRLSDKFKYRDSYKNINWYNFDEIYPMIVDYDFYGEEEKIDQERVNIVKKDWNKIIKSLMSFEKKKKYVINKSIYKARKIAKMKRINWDDFVAVMAWIEHFRSGSYRKIPKEIYEALNYLTVDPNNLPKTIYRGIFYDGAKIKDVEKFKKKWHKGSKPGLKNRKATSWTTDIETAKSFMIDQDNVKDHKNGYHVLLKYENPTYEDIVADFRDWEWMVYWNQQEVLLHPEAREYEVVEIFKYVENRHDDDKKDHPYNIFLNKKQKSGAYSGASGQNINDILKYNIFDIQYSSLPNRQKHLLLAYINKTMRDTNITFYSDKEYLYDVSIPLYQIIDKQYRLSFDNVIDKNNVTCMTSLSDIDSELTNKIYGIKRGMTYEEQNKLKSHGDIVLFKNIDVKLVYAKPLKFDFVVDLSNIEIFVESKKSDKFKNNIKTKVEKIKPFVVDKIKNNFLKVAKRFKTVSINFK